jgi:hypothetical protein
MAERIAGAVDTDQVARSVPLKDVLMAVRQATQ